MDGIAMTPFDALNEHLLSLWHTDAWDCWHDTTHRPCQIEVLLETAIASGAFDILKQAVVTAVAERHLAWSEPLRRLIDEEEQMGNEEKTLGIKDIADAKAQITVLG